MDTTCTVIESVRSISLLVQNRCLFNYTLCTPLSLSVSVIYRKSFTENVIDWRMYYDDRAPHEAELPDPWQKKLHDFQRLIVLRCIRPDKVSSNLGAHF